MYLKKINGYIYYCMSVRMNGHVTTVYLGRSMREAEAKERILREELAIGNRGRPRKSEDNPRYSNGFKSQARPLVLIPAVILLLAAAMTNAQMTGGIIANFSENLSQNLSSLAGIPEDPANDSNVSGGNYTLNMTFNQTGNFTGNSAGSEILEVPFGENSSQNASGDIQDIRLERLRKETESRLGIRLNSFKLKGSKHFLDFSLKGVRVRIDGMNPGDLKDIRSAKLPKALLKDREVRLGTETIFLNSFELDSAEITLEKTGPVNAILRCTEFSPENDECITWERTDISFTDSGDSITFNVTGFSGYAGAYITIINVQSYPTVGGEWTVEFTTDGIANLSISATNGTTYGSSLPDDLEWLSLRCGNENVPASFDGSNIFVENWNCSETGYQTVRVLSEGAHIQQFVFGDDIAYAHNWAKEGNVYNCSNCSDCNDAIQNASSGDVVQMNASITNQVGTCISFGGKDNITFDCMGNTIDGDDTDTDYGIWLNESDGWSNNNTVKNCTVTDFSSGVYIRGYNNTIANMSLSSNSYGINLYTGTGNTISGINATENSYHDLYVFMVAATICNNAISNITGSGNRPIKFFNSTVSLSDETLSGLILCNADNSSVNNLTIIGSASIKNNGIVVGETQNSNFTNINSSFREQGIQLRYDSSNNRLVNITASHSDNHGIQLYSACNNNTLEGITTDYNDFNGLWFDLGSDFNSVTNLTSTHNEVGVKVTTSQLNSISSSRITDNEYGIELANYTTVSVQNIFYNNFLNNTVNAYSTNDSNQNWWNATLNCSAGPNIVGGSCIGGNYWTDPDGNFSDTCADANGDGVCDSAYTPQTNNTDYLPLRMPLTCNCINCSDCNAKIQSAYKGDTVRLNTPVNNQSGTCISFGGKDNIIFDCMGNTIDGDDSGDDYGIWLNASNGGSNYNTITNCQVKDFDVGIYLDSSSNNTLYNLNSTSNTDCGFHVFSSSKSNNFTNVNASRNSGNGIRMTTGSYNRFTNMTFYANDGNGLTVETSSNNVITNVTSLNNSDFDIYVTASSDVHCTNSFSNITVSGSYPFMYVNYQANISNATLSELILCNASNSRIDNITIPGNPAKKNNGMILAYVLRSNISNINITNCKQAMAISGSSNNTLTNVSMLYNGINGLYMTSGSYNHFLNMRIVDGVDAFMMSGSSNRFENVTILAADDGDGIVRLSDANNNVFTNFTVEGSSSGIGMTLTSSNNNTVNNTVIKNFNKGVEIRDASSLNNLFYNNVFNNTINYNNTLQTSQFLNATLNCSAGPNIIGGRCLGGNYWTGPSGNFSDNCTDSNGNSICDSNYTISINNTDYLPLRMPRTYTCLNCSDCNTKITSATSWDTIQLIAPINNRSGSCISFSGKDNITFDCMGNTIDGDNTGTDYGIRLTNTGGGSDRVVIRRCNIQQFYVGMEVTNSDNITIMDTSINESNYWGAGIDSEYCSNVTFKNLSIHYSGVGIYSGYSDYVNISNSDLSNNAQGSIILDGSAGSECNITIANTIGGTGLPIVAFGNAENFTFSNNNNLDELLLCGVVNATITNLTFVGQTGIRASDTYSSNFSGINITDSWLAFSLYGDGNSFINMSLINNGHDGFSISGYYNYIKNMRLVNGPDTFTLSGSNNTIEDVNLSAADDGDGVLRTSGDYNTFTNITLEGDMTNTGMRLSGSSYNTVKNSYIGKYSTGITLNDEYCLNNSFYNNIFDNAVNFYNVNQTAQFLNTTLGCFGEQNIIGGRCIGGNYWTGPYGNFSDTCADSQNDGMCDSSHFIDGNNTDFLPLTEKPPWIAYELPTPPNQSVTPDNWVYVNTTVTDANNISAFIDWNQSLVGWWTLNEEDISVPPSFVQINATGCESTNPCNLTFDSATTQGNLIVVGLDWGNQGNTVSSITDDKNNTYVSIAGPADWSSNRAQMFYSKNITGGAARLTINLSGDTGGYFEVYAAEYANVDAGNPLDKSSVQTGSGTAYDSGSRTTTQASELIIGYVVSGTVDPATNFSTRSQFDANYFGDMVVNSTGSYNVAGSCSGGSWVAFMATFKAADPLNEAFDRSGYGNDGVINGAAVTAGKLEQGMSFDGSDDYISVPDIPYNYSATGITVSLWLKSATGTTGDVPISHWTDYTGFGFWSDGRWWLANGTGWNSNFTVLSGRYADTIWHMYSFTWNRTTMISYRDGVHYAESPNASGAVFVDTTLTIGRDSRGGGYFNGAIDDVHIFSRALSPEEINASYNAGLYRLEHNFTGLADGTYTYQAYAQDAAGNVNQTDQRTVIVDLTPPQISLACPSNNSYSNILDVNFSCSLTDNHGLSNATLFIWNSTGIVNIPEPKNISGTSNYTGINHTFGHDGVYWWNCLSSDAAGNQNFSPSNYTITVDTVYPLVQFEYPTPENGTGRSFMFAINASITELNLANATYNWNGTNTTYNTSHSYLASLGGDAWLFNMNQTNLSTGKSYTYYLFVRDWAGNVNSTETRTVVGNVRPSFVSMSRTPLSLDDTDPNITLSVTVNVSDTDNNLDTVKLQWKNASASWSQADNVSMQNLTAKGFFTNFTAGFTPTYEANYTYRIWANDTEGELNTSTEINVSVFYDWTWIVDRSGLGSTAAGGFSTTAPVGIFMINNTGDFNMSFSISDNSPYNPAGYPIGCGLLYNGSCYVVMDQIESNQSSKGIETYNVGATFGTTTREDFVTITILANPSVNATPSSRTVNVTLASYSGGPYFDALIDIYPSSMNHSDTAVFSAYLKNIGNETAQDVAVNWTAPSLFGISGNLAENAGNVSAGVQNRYNLSLTADPETVPVGSYTLSFNATGHGAENISDGHAVSFIVHCGHEDGVCGLGCTYLDISSLYDRDCTAPEAVIITQAGIGGAAPAAAGLSELQKQKLFQTQETYELVRSTQQEFVLKVENPFDGTFENVSVSVGGFLSRYLSISPSSVRSIPQKGSSDFMIRIVAPGYFTVGKYDLNFTVTGVISSQMSFAANSTARKLTPVREHRIVILIIHEFSAEDAEKYLNETAAIIGLMKERGLNVAELERLLSRAIASVGNKDFGPAKDVYAMAADSGEKGFATMSLLDEVTGLIDGAAKDGIGVPRTGRLAMLSSAAMVRGDFGTALQRANDAKFTYALESLGVFNVIAYVANNWPSLFAAGLAISLLSYFGILSVRFRLLSRRLVSLRREEEILLGLIREVQKDCFERGKLEMKEYFESLIQYEKKMSAVVQEIVRLEILKANMLKLLKGEREKLFEERRKLLGLIKETQSMYLDSGTLDTRIYESKMKSYAERIAEIEEGIAVLEAKSAVRSRFWKQK